VTSSSIYGGAVAANMLDNNTTSFTATGNGPNEWIKLSLGATDSISDITITNRNAGGARLNGAVVQLLDANGTVVYTFAPITGATDGAVLNFHLATPVNAAFVNIIGAPNEFLQIAELDVFGQPSPALNLTDQFAGQLTVTASSIYNGFGTNNLVDNNAISFTATGNGADEWIKLGLGGTHSVTDVILTNRNAGGERLNGAVVQLLDINGNIVYTFAPITNATDGQVFDLHLNTAVNAAFIYIDGAPAQFLQVAEIDVLGFV
jgi:hypothetical protein